MESEYCFIWLYVYMNIASFPSPYMAKYVIINIIY